jgi:cytochrome P450
MERLSVPPRCPVSALYRSASGPTATLPPGPEVPRCPVSAFYRSGSGPTATLPPGPQVPRTVQALLMAFARPVFLDWCMRRYGECFTVRLPAGANVVVLANPAAIKALFTGDADLLFAGETERARLEPIVGRESIYILDGDAHRRQRRLIRPLFHGGIVQEYGELVRIAVERELRRSPVGRPIALRRLMQEIHLEVGLEVLLGMEVGERRERLRRLLRSMLKLSTRRPRVAMSPWLQRDWQWGPWASFRKVMGELDAALSEEIRSRRSDATASERVDVLSVLTHARDKDGSSMTDAELRDQLVTLFVAGHEPMETALPAAVHLLLCNPAALVRLKRELEDGQSAYLDAVVKEVLRLAPGRSMVGRKLAGTMELNGYLLPAGTTVTASIYLTHRLPGVYADPLIFRPERFLERSPAADAWIPFGGGTRRCVAAAFATLEMRIVISTMLRCDHVRLAPRRSGMFSHGCWRPSAEPTVVLDQYPDGSGLLKRQDSTDPPKSSNCNPIHQSTSLCRS